MGTLTAVRNSIAHAKEFFANAVAQARANKDLKSAYHFSFRPRIIATNYGPIGAFLHVLDTEVAAMGYATMPFAACGILSDETGKIVTGYCDVIMNTLMANAPTPVRDAIIAHECGHAFHGHNETRDGRQLKNEIEADLYSIKHGYDMLAALEWSLAFPSKLICHDEIHDRIAAIKSYHPS